MYTPESAGAGMTPLPPVPALVPRTAGHQFVLYADSCSGGNNSRPETGRHRQVTDVIAALRPPPEFLSFPGDAVMDGGDRAQWRHWIEVEMAWAGDAGIPIYPATSNHNTYDPMSIDIYRETWSSLPGNGAAGQEKLSYWVRRGDLLYISLHQPESDWIEGRPMQRGMGDSERLWLTQTLTENSDAHHVFVAGHYPVFPVNGYREAPRWCFTPGAGKELWDILVAHGVTAYLCSHVIAFDAQAHEGVLQITSGGAGTEYGPGGFMPGPPEYLHAVQIAVDDRLRYQVIDTEGRVRESLTWPMPDSTEQWTAGPAPLGNADAIFHLRLEEIGTGRALDEGGRRPAPSRAFIPWAVSTDESVKFGIDTGSDRFMLVAHLDNGVEARWFGPTVDYGTRLRIELALHPGMGPGGVLYRRESSAGWSSMTTDSPLGLDRLARPVALHASSPLLHATHRRSQVPHLLPNPRTAPVPQA